jgi:hypothetical protein
MGAQYINVRSKNRQKEWGDQRPNGHTRSRGQQQDSGSEQPKTGANCLHSHNLRKRDISRNSSPELHQEAAALIGLTMLINLSKTWTNKKIFPYSLHTNLTYIKYKHLKIINSYQHSSDCNSVRIMKEM